VCPEEHKPCSLPPRFAFKVKDQGEICSLLFRLYNV